MQEIANKLEQIDDSLIEINETLIRQEANLDEHMRRTEALEDELKPIKKYVEQLRGAGKLVGLLAIIMTIVGVIFRLS